MEQSIKAILSTIDEAINEFQGAVPNLQKLVYEELQPIIKELQVKNGKLLNNLDNLKLIGTIQNKLERIIVSAEYKASVQKFVDSFSAVSNLNNDYFGQFNKKYKPKNTLPIIKQLAIESTINDLMGQGLNSNVIAPIQKILQQNINTGGSYSNFQEVLRNHILSNETGEGNLQRYTKQITTDAINQYNAQYGETIAQDLQFNWGRYVGSNITTTREFCTLLTAKQWVHKSELSVIIKGNIDGELCKLSKSTGLPIGLMADTNIDNFKVRRGGYNCGHQFFWVPDSSVPADVLKKFKNKDIAIQPIVDIAKIEKVLPKQPIGTPVSEQFTNIAKSITGVVSNTFKAIDSIHGDGALEDIPILNNLTGGANGAFYSNSLKAVKINISKKANSPDLTLAHEMAHYLDYQAIGKKGEFETRKLDGLTKPLIDTLNNSDRIAGIKLALKNGVFIRNKVEITLTKRLKEHLRYLLKPEEMFARAYAQFIAKRSENEKLVTQLKQRQLEDETLNIGYQWDNNDFEEIEAEMESLFIKMNWISQ